MLLQKCPQQASTRCAHTTRGEAVSVWGRWRRSNLDTEHSHDDTHTHKGGRRATATEAFCTKTYVCLLGFFLIERYRKRDGVGRGCDFVVVIGPHNLWLISGWHHERGEKNANQWRPFDSHVSGSRDATKVFPRLR